MANARAQLIEAETGQGSPFEYYTTEPLADHPSASVVLLSPRSGAYARWGKRLFDIVGSVGLIIVLMPLYLALAVAVRWKLGPGGIIFRQERLGRDGRPFTILKFRSMLPDRRLGQSAYVGVDRRRTHKCSTDPRHTPFGRWLRASSLDELPQLVNVLRGDMSLVGPRPELVEVADRGGFIDHPRHLVRPGITGRFQVSPLRDHHSISLGLHLDVEYVADVSARADAEILARTVLVLAGQKP